MTTRLRNITRRRSLRARFGALLALLALVVAPAALMAAEGEVPLIPRDVIFGNPDRAGVRISPDGKRISYLAEKDGVLNIWVAPANDPGAALAVTDDDDRGIRRYFWAYTNRHIVYLQDKDGDENWRAYSVDLKSGEEKDLTPLEGVAVRIQQVSPDHPGQILLGINDRDARLHDIYKVDLASGERTLVEENPGVLAYLTDNDFGARLAVRVQPDGSMEMLSRGEGDAWEPYFAIPTEDTLTTAPLGFDAAGDVLYMVDSRERNTAALKALDLAEGTWSVLAEDPKTDTAGTVTHPKTGKVQAVRFDYDRSRWQILDSALAKDFAYLETLGGEFRVQDRSHDDRFWIVATYSDDGPLRYYHYDRKAGEASFLFSNRKALEDLPLAKMHPRVLESRDGLALVSYLTLPTWSDPDGDGKPSSPLPLVLNVHGGPYARDSWGYSGYHQWMANRGYAVLSVNFRGSTGFGKDFLNAGNLEWAGKMHDDLIDAVNWAVAEGIADEKKVAITGGSYGGYATLVGLTFTPDVFACGVDIVGPSNLITLLRNVPPYWRPFFPTMASRIGNVNTVEGRRYLRSISPLTHVEEISVPLLIGQGANDPRVQQQESDQIVEAMQEREIPVTYLLYPDEGHGFARPDNRMSFFAVSEAFLAEHLGGRFEPIGGSLEGSSVEVVTGAEGVPGLADALGR